MPQNIYYDIEPGRREHIPILGAIELAASSIFPPGALPDFACQEVTPQHYFQEALAQGNFWVALHEGEPVGYSLLRFIPSSTGLLALLAQIDVHPEHARRGLGRRLVLAAADKSRAGGYSWLYLTTFGSIPWNAPFYSRLGFVELSENAIPESVEAILREEREAGFKNRVAMRLEL